MPDRLLAPIAGGGHYNPGPQCINNPCYMHATAHSRASNALLVQGEGLQAWARASNNLAAHVLHAGPQPRITNTARVPLLPPLA